MRSEMQLLLNPRINRRVTAGFAAVVGFLPSLLLAHPGHAHPDETDEFDFFVSQLLHSHGPVDYLIGAIILGSLVTAFFAEKLAVRIAALVSAAGSLALISLS